MSVFNTIGRTSSGCLERQVSHSIYLSFFNRNAALLSRHIFKMLGHAKFQLTLSITFESYKTFIR